MIRTESIADLTNRVWGAADAMRAEGLLVTDYMEQLSLFMFLKMLQEREDSEREQAALLGGDVHSVFDDQRYRWAAWSSLSGPLMRDFFVHELFPYLQDRPGMLGKIFRDVGLAIEDPNTLKTVVKILDDVPLTSFGFDAMGQMYEHFLRRLADAGAAGEYFTYRHVIDAMVQIIDPDLGQTIYDPALGTAGFLTRSLEWIKAKRGGGRTLSQKDWAFLRRRAFWGHEVNRRTYRMALLNMYLHGIDEPNIDRIDTLGVGSHVGREYDVVLSNPPYGAKVVKENVRPGFIEPTPKSQLLFLQHIMQSVAPGGRAAMIADEGLYFQAGAFARVREALMRDFEVRAVVSLPSGVFEPYTGVKSSIVFFWRSGRPTSTVWFYDVRGDGSSLSSARKFGPEYANDLPDLLAKWPGRVASERSWSATREQIAAQNWNLTASRYNPNRADTISRDEPTAVLRDLNGKHQLIRDELEGLLDDLTAATRDVARLHQRQALRKLVTVMGGGTPSRNNPAFWDGPIPWVSPKDMKVWEIRDSEEHVSADAVAHSAARWIEPGAVLVVVRGMILIRTVPIAIARVRLTLNQDMKALIAGEELLPDYLAWMLRSAQDTLLKAVEVASHGTRRLSTDVLRDLEIPLPTLDVQAELVALVEGVRARVETATALQ